MVSVLVLIPPLAVSNPPTVTNFVPIMVLLFEAAPLISTRVVLKPPIRIMGGAVISIELVFVPPMRIFEASVGPIIKSLPAESVSTRFVDTPVFARNSPKTFVLREIFRKSVLEPLTVSVTPGLVNDTEESVFAESVPPTVPLLLILKLLEACGDVPF